MNFTGILIGMISFLIIGLFHPIVIWAEYYFSKKIWPAFAGVGLLCLLPSLLSQNAYLSCAFAVISASSFWSIKELFEQEQRVLKGWFPKNSKRTYQVSHSSEKNVNSDLS